MMEGIAPSAVNSERLPYNNSLKHEPRDAQLSLKRLKDGRPVFDFPFHELPTNWHSTADSFIQCLAWNSAYRDRWVSVSLHKSRYNNVQQKYEGILYRYEPIKQIFEWLVRHEIVVAERGQTWGQGGKGRQTRVRLANKYAAKAYDIHRASKRAKRVSLLELKDRDKKPIPFACHRNQKRMLKELEVINDAAAAPRWVLPGKTHGHIMVLDPRQENLGRYFLDTRETKYHRSFNNNSWKQGGRLYGHFIQELTKVERCFLLLDGEKTDEVDFKSLHPRMAYAEAGLEFNGDAYEIEGYPRHVVKLALNVLINAESEKSAMRMLTDARNSAKQKHAKMGLDWPYYGFSNSNKDALRELFKLIRQKHSQIADYFGSGAGVKLQFRDSQMMVRIMLRLIDLGIPHASLHDSVVCKKSDREAVANIMRQEFQREFSKETPNLTNLSELIEFKGEKTGRDHIMVSPICVRTVDLRRGVLCGEPDLFAGYDVQHVPVIGYWCRNTLGRALDFHLKSSATSQRNFGATVGLSRSTVSGIANRQFTTSKANAAKILAAIGYDPYDQPPAQFHV